MFNSTPAHGEKPASAHANTTRPSPLPKSTMLRDCCWCLPCLRRRASTFATYNSRFHLYFECFHLFPLICHLPDCRSLARMVERDVSKLELRMRTNRRKPHMPRLQRLPRPTFYHSKKTAARCFHLVYLPKRSAFLLFTRDADDGREARYR